MSSQKSGTPTSRPLRSVLKTPTPSNPNARLSCFPTQMTKLTDQQKKEKADRQAKEREDRVVRRAAGETVPSPPPTPKLSPTAAPMVPGKNLQSEQKGGKRLSFLVPPADRIRVSVKSCVHPILKPTERSHIKVEDGENILSRERFHFAFSSVMPSCRQTSCCTEKFNKI